MNKKRTDIDHGHVDAATQVDAVGQQAARVIHWLVGGLDEDSIGTR
jgi:hypothetical protein